MGQITITDILIILWNIEIFIWFILILSNPKFYTTSLYLKNMQKLKKNRDCNFLFHSRIKQYNVYKMKVVKNKVNNTF